MFATLATGIFRNYPWHLGQHNLLTILLVHQKMESKCIEFTLEEDPLLNMCTLYRRHDQLN